MRERGRLVVIARTRRGRRARALCASVGLALLASCGGAGPTESVVLISIDTLRADRLGAYGYARATSPALDRLAARGLLFEHVVAESGWTLPSHVTMLTGLAPATHGVVLPHLRVAADTRLLAEHLRDAGLRTHADTGGGFVGRRYGFARGFETFHDERDGLAVKLQRAREFIEGLARGERYFAFVHTFDVHCPYDARSDLVRAFRSEGAEFIETDGRCGNPDFNARPLSAAEVLHISDRYDAGIREADELLGGFVEWLDARGELERTLLVVTSDHGEEFHEHGQIGHERSLYREVLMVPWIIVGPRVVPGRRAVAAGLADVAPTLVELLGLPPLDGAPSPALAGRSLAGHVTSASWSTGAEATPERARHSTLSWKAELRSVMTDREHLVWNLQDERAELYLWREDGRETTNRAASEPERVEELRKVAVEAGAMSTRHAPTVDDLTESERAELRALGYGE